MMQAGSGTVGFVPSTREPNERLMRTAGRQIRLAPLMRGRPTSGSDLPFSCAAQRNAR